MQGKNREDLFFGKKVLPSPLPKAFGGYLRQRRECVLCRHPGEPPFLEKEVPHRHFNLYTQRAVTVFSSMNMLMEAILDLAVPTKD